MSGSFRFDESFTPAGFLKQYTVYPDSRVTFQCELEMPATAAQTVRDATKPKNRAAFVLDGATLKAKAGADGTSFADYLAGVTSLHLGAGGATVDTCGEDVTITQPLSPTGLVATAGFAKRGAGTLTLGGSGNLNWMYGPLDVAEGTLTAGFETGVHKPIPEGAEILWTFDGADPFADKTGHGNNLEDIGVSGYETVAVTDENACVGRAIRFPSAAKAALKSTQMVSGNDFKKHMSVVVNFRLASHNMPYGHSSFMSTRCSRDMSVAADASFDVGFKSLSESQVGSKTTGLGSVWAGGRASVSRQMIGEAFGVDDPDSWNFTIGEWYQVCFVRDGTTIKTYLNGVLVRTNENSDGGFVNADNYMITLGQGHKGGEVMQNDGMLDEIAVYSRALTGEEVVGLYAGASAVATFPVTVAEGAVWDMNASTAAVTTVTGGGAITNGTLAIASAIAPNAAHTLHIAHPEIASPSGTLSFATDPDTRLAKGTPITLFTFDEMDAVSAANLAAWQATDLGYGNKLRARIGVDRANGRVTGEILPAGTLVYLR